MDTSFSVWVDLDPQSSRNAPEWCPCFIQRAFVESHGGYPKEEEIEDWVEGLLPGGKALWLGETA